MNDLRLKTIIFSCIYIVYLITAFMWVLLGGAKGGLAIMVMVIYGLQMFIPIGALVLVNVSKLKDMTREFKKQYKNHLIGAFGTLGIVSIIQLILSGILYAITDNSKIKNFDNKYTPPIYLAIFGIIQSFLYTILLSTT